VAKQRGDSSPRRKAARDLKEAVWRTYKRMWAFAATISVNLVEGRNEDESKYRR
jgi:hypothetical protein